VIIKAWRITQAIHAATAFTGIGAWLEGGRWNHKGIHMVYTAGSLALAALEIVVHLPEDALLYKRYVRIPMQFDSSQVIELAISDLPKNWNDHPPSESTQQISSSWTAEKKSLVLKVPSSIIPEEYNYLINPLHPDASEMKTGESESFKFDPRLKR
jgi:RES domain-containing protein